MLPPQPLPVVPQGAEPPPPLPGRLAGCLWPLFGLGWDFWFWSCGLLFKSNVCAQPKLTRNREQRSARRTKFFFTGTTVVRVAERTRGHQVPRTLPGFSESACHKRGSSSVLIL